MATDSDTLRHRQVDAGVRALRPTRDRLVQVFVSTEEKQRMTDLARQAGDESLSSYVRRCALRPPTGQPQSAA